MESTAVALWLPDGPPRLRGDGSGGLGAQLNECSRQRSRPVLALCSMGFGLNPLISDLIQHTFKLNILFLEKFRVIHFDHDVSEKKNF